MRYPRGFRFKISLHRKEEAVIHFHVRRVDKYEATLPDWRDEEDRWISEMAKDWGTDIEIHPGNLWVDLDRSGGHIVIYNLSGGSSRVIFDGPITSVDNQDPNLKTIQVNDWSIDLLISNEKTPAEIAEEKLATSHTAD